MLECAAGRPSQFEHAALPGCTLARTHKCTAGPGRRCVAPFRRSELRGQTTTGFRLTGCCVPHSLQTWTPLAAEKLWPKHAMQCCGMAALLRCVYTFCVYRKTGGHGQFGSPEERFGCVQPRAATTFPFPVTGCWLRRWLRGRCRWVGPCTTQPHSSCVSCRRATAWNVYGRQVHGRGVLPASEARTRTEELPNRRTHMPYLRQPQRVGNI